VNSPRNACSPSHQTPCVIQAVEAMPMESLPGVRQKHEILVTGITYSWFFPFLSDMKVAEDLDRVSGFERSVYE